MTADMLFVALALAAVGAAVGAAAVPWAADALLKRKKRAYDAWWDKCADGYEAFVARTGRAPSRKARGEEGALGIWAADTLRLQALGALEERQEERLRGLALADEDAEAHERNRQAVESALALAKATARASVPGGRAEADGDRGDGDGGRGNDEG